MANDFISGSRGTVNNGAAVNNVTSWKMSTKAGVDKFATTGSSGWKVAVAGAKEWDGSIDGKMDGGAPFTEGATVTLDLGMGTAGPSFGGDAIIESIDYDVDIMEGKAVGYSAKFSGDGELTTTAPS